MRLEQDTLGSFELTDQQYYGLQTARAVVNFPILGQPIHPDLVLALVQIKKAAVLTHLANKHIDSTIGQAINQACDDVLAGALADQFIVDAFQGGAGTSAHMNVNEVLANRALELIGAAKGDYTKIHPIDHVNLYQSTNDVFPTAVRIAAINRLKSVSEAFARLQTTLQAKEQEFATVLKVGRTQLQDAVPVTLGQEFGAWAQAIARDRWRLYKVEERLRQVNIGGTAVGTGINAPRKYLFTMIDKLREVTGIGLARADYLMDPTQNNDVFVEVSGLLKTAAVNLTKLANDLRLLASGPRAGFGEIRLPALQSGSSIMPGKVNPVMPEAVNQVAYQVMANDLAITLAAQGGQLELNAFLPLIAHNLLQMLDLLDHVIPLFIDKCIVGIEADVDRCQALLNNSTAIVTALTGYIGYDQAAAIAKESLATGTTVSALLLQKGLLTAQQLEIILKPETMTSPGIPGSK
ncbi:MAG: aspartate ammonia-lyase [Eubacteriales bacterium]|nr:aspartate ammonia-lyase [Eubacteriales bacterium]